MSLGEIENKVKAYQKQRSVLAERVEECNAKVTECKRRAMPGIKSAANKTAEARDALQREISAHPELFQKPKTLVINGVKVGYTKQPGKLSWNDDEKVCQKIEKELPDQYDVLVKTTRKPVRKALSNLAGSMLKRLGIRVEDDTDEVVVKATDSEIDKLIDRMMKDVGELEDKAA